MSHQALQSDMSLMNMLWQEKTIDVSRSIAISSQYDIPHIISSAITHCTDIEKYLSPKLHAHFIDPLSISNMRDVRDKILSYLDKKIILFGDYDVDGSASVAMLYTFLHQSKAKNCTFYIPNRFTEGYGPNMHTLSMLTCDLMIFLDCGTNAVKEIEYLLSRKIDVIVIDHHTVKTDMPCIMLNPKTDMHASSDLTNLCTGGLTLMVITALNSILKTADVKSYLGLAAIATVCDIMPLVSFNRLIVKKGLEVLNKNKFLQSLLKTKEITSHTIGFKIGPMLNAGSRMSDSSLATRFLINQNLDDGNTLLALNEERKSLQKIIYENALTQVKNNMSNQSVKYILVYSKTWHKGVIGIVAAKLVEKYSVPAFVGVENDNSIITFSVRSTPRIDISQIIFKAIQSDLFLNGGGHAMAGGFAISKGKINELYGILNDSLSIQSDIHTQYCIYNSNISIFGIHRLKKHLHYLEPTGYGNEHLKFRILGLRLTTLRIIKDEVYHIEFEDLLEQKIHTLCFKSHLIQLINKHARYDLFVSVTLESVILEDAILVKRIHGNARCNRHI